MLPPPTSYSVAAVCSVVGGLVVAGILAVAVGPAPAAYLLAAVAAGLAVARAFLPKDRVEPFVIREVWIDVPLMGGVAVSLTLLALIAPF